MNSMDFSTGNWIQMIVYLVSFAFAWGGVSQKLKHLDSKIDSLEKKQDKHNSVIERVTALEIKVGNNERRLSLIEQAE